MHGGSDFLLETEYSLIFSWSTLQTKTDIVINKILKLYRNQGAVVCVCFFLLELAKC